MNVRIAGLAIVLVCTARAAAQQAAPRFDHARHARVSPSCVGCHAGVARGGAPVYPDPETCAACHDGAIEPRVSWTPPTSARRTNLAFDHARHAGHRGAVAGRPAAGCVDCHVAVGAAWMAVQRAAVARCLDCHAVRTAHLAAPDSACATCHVPLARSSLAREDVARFTAPPSHDPPDYAVTVAHGTAARASTQACATCHAREFCLTCHVDAPEQAAIAALPLDPRATAIATRLVAPPSHAQPGFLEAHGRAAATAAATCATCHTRESCLVCHASAPKGGAVLHRASAGRSAGAVVTRRPPPSHTTFFADRHATAASAGTATCAGCHVRADCLDCHRPAAGAGGRGYHPAAFLSRHPAAAYARESSCADCHNTAGFCASCHEQSGLTPSPAPLRTGFHDAKQYFLAGHGQAARQNLESCVSCHAERDCLPCHATRVVGGRGLSPHGPGFDAERLRKKNPNMCMACHGTNIPPP